MMVGHPEIDDDGVGRSMSTAALVVRVDDVYDAALAVLLAQATRRPGLFERIGRAVLSALKALHARKRDDAECLDPWYWYYYTS